MDTAPLPSSVADIAKLPGPAAIRAWQDLRPTLADNAERFARACEIYGRLPRNGFFAKEVLDLGALAGQEAAAARLILSTAAADEARAPAHPVMKAVLALSRVGGLDGAELDRAVALRDRLIDAAPRAGVYRAILAQWDRDLERAIGHLQGFVAEHPDDVEAVMLYANLAMQSGRPARHAPVFARLRDLPTGPRGAQLADGFDSLCRAVGLDPADTDSLLREQARLETPGGIYELAMRMAPPPDPEPRSGVVMMTGSLAGGGAERIVAMTFRRFRELEPDEDAQLWLFSKSDSPGGNPLFYLPLTGLTEDQLHVVEASDRRDPPFCWLPPFYAMRAQGIYEALMQTRPRVAYFTLDEAVIAGGIAAVMAGVPKIVIHCHNMSPPNLHGDSVLSFGWDRAYRALLGRPNVQYINVAKAAVDDYLAWTGVTDPVARTDFVHNGVDFSAIDEGLTEDMPRQIRAELGIPEDAQIVGTALRFAEVKQPHVWIEAARLVRQALPGTHFILYGDGRLLDQTRALAAEAGLADCVHFPGRVSDLAHRLPVFDVLVLSSRSEGFPNVLIEAQAAGVVPIAFDVGGCRETMDPGRTGHVVTEKTPEALAAQIVAVLADPAELARTKARGMRFVRETFSFDRMIAQLHGIVYPQPVPASEDAPKAGAGGGWLRRLLGRG